jgi:hypothetical protein
VLGALGGGRHRADPPVRWPAVTFFPPRPAAFCACLAPLSLGILPATAGAHEPHRAAPRLAVRVHPPKHKLGSETAGNWAGYSIDGANAINVSGSWMQPTAHCSPEETSWSSPWLGIDGDTSNTVEQIGTDSDCNGGSPSYYAWYEMYPKQTTDLAMTITPGDVISAQVTATSSTTFRLTLTDETTKATFTTTQTSKKARRNSVEWIMEGPSGSSGLTDFGTAGFSGAAATIGGRTGGLFSFGSQANAITMVTSSGQTRAAPSAVSSSSGFSVSWEHA